ncbi:MAG: sigma-54-dependent Fis family transcriptional regulator [Fibrobacteres bacterium]|nr:sigma-54-dependent Fis family transcriptional regulator [Fibrobacterota bacterium]
MRLTVLVVDDMANMRALLRSHLERSGHAVSEASNGLEALDLVGRQQFDLVITDLKMPEMDGMKLLAEGKKAQADLRFVMMTAHGTMQDAIQAMKLGAQDFISKPFELTEIDAVLKKIEDGVDAQDDIAGEAGVAPEMIGRSAGMTAVRDLIGRAAPSDSTVLILGESGTGKELAARAIHEGSSRKGAPFVAVNCAAFGEGVLESELFGHEKGAFTGAVSARAGRFELADGGTLFLDELGEIPLSIQVKLLRVLQERCFERVGGVREVKSDFRLVAATNRKLDEEVKAGRFREDLYYRLNIIPISLPPLRERREDIPLLVNHMLEKLSVRVKRRGVTLAPETLEKLVAYNWPGNIRELENILERTIVLSKNDKLLPSDLPQHLVGSAVLSAAPASPSEGGFKEAIKSSKAGMEREYISQALKEENGNRTNTAKRLGISRKGLQLKIKEYGLE